MPPVNYFFRFTTNSNCINIDVKKIKKKNIQLEAGAKDLNIRG